MPRLICAIFVVSLLVTAEAARALPIWGAADFPAYAPVEDSLVEVERVHHDFVQRPGQLEVHSIYELRLPAAVRSSRELLIQRRVGDPWSADAAVELTRAALGRQVVRFAPVKSNETYRLELPTSGQRVRLVLDYVVPFGEGTSLAFDAAALFRPARLVIRGQEPGWDTRRLDGFSSEAPEWTSVKVTALPRHIVLASAPLVGGRMEPQKLGKLALFFADEAAYERPSSFTVSGTRFDIVTRRGEDSVIDRRAFIDTTATAWPTFSSWFGPATRYVALIEQVGAIGAGPVGSNMLGFATSKALSTEEQAGIRLVTGWEGPLDSTRSIVETLYAGSSDPLYEYFSNMLVHELGHLYFGFGLTGERHVESHAFWFSLGLGIVYDRLISQAKFGRDPPIYQALVDQLVRFEQNPAIDQRLIAPDTSRDLENGVYPFNRTQNYAHIKATRVLATLREAAGPKTFDELVRRFLASGHRARGYDSLRPLLLRHLPNLPDLERELKI